MNEPWSDEELEVRAVAQRHLRRTRYLRHATAAIAAVAFAAALLGAIRML